MWTRDLRIYTVVYTFWWKPRLENEEGEFERWGEPQLDTRTARIVAPSDYYAHAWILTKFDYDPESKPEVKSISVETLDAIINPNHP